jgi:hypothetical protein
VRAESFKKILLQNIWPTVWPINAACYIINKSTNMWRVFFILKLLHSSVFKNGQIVGVRCMIS